MKRFILAALAIPLAWLVLSVSPAAAQNTYPYQQPMFRPGWQTPLSPYLNMLIPGNPAVNYYALVEPQFQRRQYRNLMNQTIQNLANQINQIPPAPGIMTEEEFNAPMNATGHPVAFNYTGSYFNSNMVGQPIVNAFPQRRIGPGTAGPMGPGGRPMGPGMGGMMGGSGTWPNMRPGMGPPGR